MKQGHGLGAQNVAGILHKNKMQSKDLCIRIDIEESMLGTLARKRELRNPFSFFGGNDLPGKAFLCSQQGWLQI
jgi:hypothetical protein